MCLWFVLFDFIVTLDLVDSKMRSCYFGPIMDVDHNDTHIMERQQWFRSVLEKIKTGCPGRVKATSPIGKEAHFICLDLCLYKKGIFIWPFILKEHVALVFENHL